MFQILSPAKSYFLNAYPQTYLTLNSLQFKKLYLQKRAMSILKLLKTFSDMHSCEFCYKLNRRYFGELLCGRVTIALAKNQVRLLTRKPLNNTDSAAFFFDFFLLFFRFCFPSFFFLFPLLTHSLCKKCSQSFHSLYT